jgi:hypothetical protein|tara:strand:+ start:345 stop:467 length:123 start_codon:yes stop_codon:yes gene_type:complete
MEDLPEKLEKEDLDTKVVIIPHRGRCFCKRLLSLLINCET